MRTFDNFDGFPVTHLVPVVKQAMSKGLPVLPRLLKQRPT
uniref:Uncharacterized protein n=1 Tax=Tetranychus urticae TaxID=32264 RepID=T1K6F7_TETUR